jgi:small-conductance mechanosensitive channel
MPHLDGALGALGIPPELAWRGLATIAVLVAWVTLIRVARRLVGRSIDDVSVRFQFVRMTSYVVGVLAVLVLARIWIQGIAGVGTYLGLLSAGIAIALQDPLTNLAGWVFILLRRPFRIGDRIQIGTHMGDVVDIRLFRFVLLEIGNWVHAEQSTGRVLHVPNGFVFKNTVANYDEAFGFIWNELEVTVVLPLPERDFSAT